LTVVFEKELATGEIAIVISAISNWRELFQPSPKFRSIQ